MSRSLPPFDPRMPPATPGRHDAVADPQRRRLLLAVGLGAGVTLAGALPRAYAAAPATVVASTGHGRVRGVSEQGVHTFKGIRYGADTAATRFQPPSPPAPWRGVADALAYGASAPQRGAEGPGSEDCLFLNVWTPALDGAARRPVLVYFHGGGYDNGSGSDRLYDGTRLCRRGDVVVVTVNHRLNAFGYLYLGLLGDTRHAASGNAGQLDLVLALQWVRANIARFGGDPGNVTVFGQSGGGAKIATLMAMPAARGLFHKAWTMSGQQVTAAGPRAATQRAQLVGGNLQTAPFSDVRSQIDQYLPLRGVGDGFALQRFARRFASDSHVFELVALEDAVKAQFAVDFGLDAHNRLVGAQKRGQFDRGAGGLVNRAGAQLDAFCAELLAVLFVVVLNPRVVHGQAVDVEFDRLAGGVGFGARRGRCRLSRCFSAGGGRCGLADVLPIAVAVFVTG